MLTVFKTPLHNKHASTRATTLHKREKMALKSARLIWLFALIDYGFTLLYFLFVLLMRSFGFLATGFTFYLCFLNLLSPLVATFGILGSMDAGIWPIRILFFLEIFLVALNLIEFGIRLLFDVSSFVPIILLLSCFVWAGINGLILYAAYKTMLQMTEAATLASQGPPITVVGSPSENLGFGASSSSSVGSEMTSGTVGGETMTASALGNLSHRPSWAIKKVE